MQYHISLMLHVAILLNKVSLNPYCSLYEPIRCKSLYLSLVQITILLILLHTSKRINSIFILICTLCVKLQNESIHRLNIFYYLIKCITNFPVICILSQHVLVILFCVLVMHAPHHTFTFFFHQYFIIKESNSNQQHAPDIMLTLLLAFYLLVEKVKQSRYFIALERQNVITFSLLRNET